MNAAKKEARRASRKAIRYRLPTAARRVLREKLLSAQRLTTEMAEALDGEFGLREKYGVVQVWRFLERERATAEEDVFLAKLKGVRRRQKRAGKVLKKTMGKEGESERQIWEDGSYLTLVERIYVRLMEDESQLPTDELTALSKAMAEHRRVSARDGEATEKEAVKGEGDLPECLANAVRQLYGIEFPSPKSPRLETPNG